MAFPYVAEESDNSSDIVDKNKPVHGESDESEDSSAEGEYKEESVDRHSFRHDSDDEPSNAPSFDYSESSEDDEYDPDDPSYEDDGNSGGDVNDESDYDESVVNAPSTHSPSSTSLASAESSVPKPSLRKSIRCRSSSSSVKQSLSSGSSALFDSSVPKRALQKPSTRSSFLHHRGKSSFSIAPLESNDSFFPEATLPNSTRREDKAKATVALRQPSSIAKRRSSAELTIPTTIAVRTADIQPRTPSAHASSSRAKLAVGHMREGMRLPPTSVRKAYKRLRHIAKGNASATFSRMRKSSSLRRNRHAAISTAMAKNEDSIPKQMLDACGGREERRIIEEFMGDKVLGPVVLWFENYRISLSGLNVPKDGKVPMLDPDRVSKYGLETIYLVNCSSEGNFYATTDSAQRIHGAVYCHQMADVIATIQDICKREQVVIVGANECYEDDVLMVKNGLSATSLDGWKEIDFRSIHTSLFSGKGNTLGKHNNNVISHGYSVAGKDRELDKDGLHPPQVKSNTKNHPIVGSHFVALSKLIVDADRKEKFLQRSGDVYDSRKKYAKRILVKTGLAVDGSTLNFIEGNSYIGNCLPLAKIKQTKAKVPLDGHLDLYNSGMDGFSGFFGVSKTQISRSGTVVRIGAVGYNRAAVDHVTLQKVVKQTVLHQVGPVAEKLFPRERREVFPHVPRMLGEHAAEGGVFAVPSHLNIAVFESLICTGIMDVQANHGASVNLVAELMSCVPFMNGADKGFDGFTHIASLEELPSDNLTKYYADRNNTMTGNNFSHGSFERHRPACQKPIPLPFIIHNSFVISRIIKAANDDGLPFSEALKILKRDVMGAHYVVAPRILRLLSLTGNIVSNRFAVGADIPKKLATKVRGNSVIVEEALPVATTAPLTQCRLAILSIPVPRAMAGKQRHF